MAQRIVQCLTAGSSADATVRKQAEVAITQMKASMPDFGVHLARVVVEKSVSLPIRQLGGTILRHYVNGQWQDGSDSWTGPVEIPAQFKKPIRDALGPALADPQPRIRSMVACVMASIAQWDWPEQWPVKPPTPPALCQIVVPWNGVRGCPSRNYRPELFPGLIQGLQSTNPALVHGVMRMLTEFILDQIDTNQIPKILPVLIPQLFKIFAEPKHDVRTRSRCVTIFTSLIAQLHVLVEMHAAEINLMVTQILPQWMQLFIQVLAAPISPTADVGLKTEVFRSLAVLAVTFPKEMFKYLDHLLPPLFGVMVSGLSDYIKTSINETEDAETVTDEDGEVLGFEQMISSMFLVVTHLVQNPKNKPLRKAIGAQLENVFLHVISYAQMTEDQADRWISDPSEFVAEAMDEDNYTASLRDCAQDLIMELLTAYGGKAATALVAATTKLIQQGATAQAAKDENWWKPVEVCLFAYTMKAEGSHGASAPMMLMKMAQSGKFGLEAAMTQIMQFLQVAACPFLQGRAFSAAAAFAEVLPVAMLQQLLQASLAAMGPGQAPPVTISAIVAIQKFCSALQDSHADAAAPFISKLFEVLTNLAVQTVKAKGSPDVLIIILDTLMQISPVHPATTLANESKILPLANACFINFTDQPFVVDAVQDLISELAGIPQLSAAVHARLLPTLVDIVQKHEDPKLLGLVERSVELLKCIAEAIPDGQPFPAGLMNHAFPAIVKMMMQSIDAEALQNGSECLRIYVSKATPQLVAWTDGATTGIQYVMQIIVRLLRPETPEGASVFAGMLVTRVLMKARAQVQAHVPALLKAVLDKLNAVSTVTNIQQLIMVFAQIIVQDMPSVMAFLTSQGALGGVFTLWTKHQESFCGKYTLNVTIAALCKVFASRSPALAAVIVEGDEIVQAGAGIRTRSAAKKAPSAYQKIPLLAKIGKLLLKEYGQIIVDEADEASGAGGGAAGGTLWEDDEGSEDGEWEDDDAALAGLATKSPFAPAEDFEFDLSDVIDLGMGFWGDEDPELDDDIKADPLFELDRKGAIVESMKLFASVAAAAQQLFPLLSPAEQVTIQKALQ